MPVLDAQADESIGALEIRAVLDTLAGSEPFRSSPQLIAFLRYVVDATLRGEADRIKGYTIAVEALGRDADFDPQSDPIVRVEATRLRRALRRYYAEAGAHDCVRIELPLGSYVPVFHCATAQNAPPPQSDPPSAPAPSRWRPALSLANLHWRSAAAGAALVLAVAGVYGAFDYWFDSDAASRQPMVVQAGAQIRAAPESGLAQSIFPVVFVGPFKTMGNVGDSQPAADALRARLRDALARFDEINVVNGAAPDNERARAVAADPASPSQYGLSARVETDAAGLLRISALLTNVADGQIVFSRAFERPRGATDAGSAEDVIVRDVAAALAQPYGVIHARERASRIGSTAGHPHYRCLIESYDFWRTYEPALHARARECLERAIEADPSFAAGYASLAELVLHEYRRGLNLRPGDAPPLERALRAARRAVELKPGSAKAYQALMDVQFLRGEYGLALTAGEKAVMLNPYNPNILACYGARLIALGQLEKGSHFLNEAAASLVVRPAWIDFFLFLAAYLGNDRNAAATHAAQIMSEQSMLGFLAQALVAVQDGKPAAARQQIERLIALQPGWRDNARHELKKMFPSDAVTNPLARDLAMAGLTASN